MSDTIKSEFLSEDKIPEDIPAFQRQRKQAISDSAREKIRQLCKKINVCRENPALVEEFGVDGYDIYLIHSDSMNMKHGDGFIITRNGIYCKKWNAGKYDAPSFTLFEDIARADIVRYDKKYQFTIIYPNRKGKPLAYYTACAGVESVHNLFCQIANICIEELFPGGKIFKLNY